MKKFAEQVRLEEAYVQANTTQDGTWSNEETDEVSSYVAKGGDLRSGAPRLARLPGKKPRFLAHSTKKFYPLFLIWK